ncbi:SGNH/GDSL hydrolase family protein [Yinghuangia sp. KLBMP8922]|uniref:triacylglycerol lipase n=1 Tax=Yinghuangia soli TaxID=2908204 RepID=A0AA41PWH3_9ACTN|nr:SGNH/GDSL hydrolase family protein [Yinghuangia soli]
MFVAPSAHAATGRYVALGDSYSAGLGAGSYDSASGNCKRSSKSYPALWAAANAPSSFAFVACSGAKTGDVLNNQISAVNSSTELVSITIGGNDAGFAGIMTTCVLQSESTCLNAVAQARTFAENQLPGLLDQVYAAIRARAPSAHVVVLGYSRLYKIGGGCLFGIGDTKRKALNGAADTLDTVIAKRAADAGFTFGDVRPIFTGHEICSGSAWLHSTTWPIEESYHPNASGQSKGYLPVFNGLA